MRNQSMPGYASTLYWTLLQSSLSHKFLACFTQSVSFVGKSGISRWSERKNPAHSLTARPQLQGACPKLLNVHHLITNLKLYRRSLGLRFTSNFRTVALTLIFQQLNLCTQRNNWKSDKKGLGSFKWFNDGKIVLTVKIMHNVFKFPLPE